MSILYEKLNYNGLWENSDSDSIPNVIEDKPILTSFGYFVNSNPHEGDTDGDNLLDSEELVMQDYVIWYLKCFDSLTGYPNNPHRAFIINNYDILRYKLTCFVMNSDPELADTDNDGAGDAEDATPMKKNGPINYILCDVTDADCLDTAAKYYQYFKSNNMECQRLPIYTNLQFEYFFKYLDYGFNGVEKIVNNGIGVGGLNRLEKKHYATVENIIIIFHGKVDKLKNVYINTAEDVYGHIESIYAYEIKDSLSNCADIEIKNIDYQCCLSAYSNNCLSLVVETLKATNAESVYGSTGELIFEFDSNQVLFGTYNRYWMNDYGEVLYSGKRIWFNVMERWGEESKHTYKLENYPE